jgi:ectoine hydroxylase-related dioxygenase (phytanoyl-CoA dioxygenase family)
VYQRPPTVRVHCPGHVAPIGLHCDADYPKHEGGEINVWVPLTRSYGSNALWLESAPGSGDFAPVELPYGSALVFNGCRCRHYAMPNATGATRVSFDLRAIPAEVWRDDYNRKIGDYDASVCAPGGNEALVDAEPS